MNTQIAIFLFFSLPLAAQISTYPAASGGSSALPTGSGNKVVATPADGSSGVSALRAMVAADVPKQLASTAIQSPVATTLSSCATTANAVADIVATGAGCLFLTQLTPGDRVYLSSDSTNIGTVTHITSNTEFLLDADYWGDSLGNGTSQTITVMHAAFQIRNVAGLPFLIANDAGHLAYGPVPLVTEAGDPVVPTPSQVIAIRSASTGTLLDLESQTLASNGAAIFELNNQFNELGHSGTGAVTNFFENDSYGFISVGAGKVTNAAIYYGQVINYSATVVDKLGVFWAKAPTAEDGAAGFTEGVEFYGDDLGASQITNPYYSWFDSRGVRRVKEDKTFDSVGQAIEALYNPLFTKYTAGATDFERIVLGQWNGNVAEIGNQAGGTGTLRPLKLLGASVAMPGAGAANTAVCWKAGGVIGWASNTAGVIGTTCN